MIARVRTGVDLQGGSWTNAPFWLLHTVLNPATLFYAKTKTLSCFTHLDDAGLGAPAFAVFNHEWGPRPVRNGMAMDPSSMLECWVMVWFAGAKGWTNGDCPWVVFLQHKPAAIRLDERGLHFEFPREAGHVVFLPLYGCTWLPSKGAEVQSKRGATEKSIKTWEWENRIPREVFARVRYWASAMREFPAHGEENFGVDRGRDAVVIRSAFQWLPIADDWRTQPLKLAPVSPLLGRAWMQKLPVTFSHKIFDMELPVPNGPFLGAQGVDSFDATLPLSKYVNEVRTGGGQTAVKSELGESLRMLVFAGTNQSTAQAALDRFRRTAHWEDGVETRSRTPTWPELTCQSCEARTGAPRSFGRIVPGASGGPKSTTVVPVNGDARLAVYELP